MNVIDAIHERHAVRSYRSDPIPEDAVHRLLDAAVHAPTAMHLEPWVFVVIQDRKKLRALSDRAGQDFNIFYDAGTLIAIGARPLGAFVDADCWLAAENLMLAAREMGLGSCPIGFAVPILNEESVKAELGVPKDVTVVAPIIIGVPQEIPSSSPRNAPNVVRWIR